MNNDSHKNKHDTDNLSGFLATFLFFGGLMLGGLAGAGTMLLLAPQSGKKTRKQIQRKARKVHKQTAETIEHGVNQVTTGIQKQVEDLQQHAQGVVDDQKERWEPVIEAGKTAVQG
jgi:gas vesicle protein